MWLRKFETSGTLEEWREMGFFKVVLLSSNGYRKERTLEFVPM
ncbi:hypothetical protein ACFS7Z_22725 [Pontibacter toksunensis]|uniref:Uncharacterized protein n=1 Tax=Pontibacter toksunensis TaxID=1332631 RepID=A0ABW6BZF2_9BACT